MLGGAVTDYWPSGRPIIPLQLHLITSAVLLWSNFSLVSYLTLALSSFFLHRSWQRRGMVIIS